MSNDTEQLKKRIIELEDELKQKNAELLRYRQEIGKVNKSLEGLMASMSHDLQLAQQLQRYLTPTEIPNISGFEWSTKFNPGSKFGGDYFDIFEHEDKFKFGILMASSSGYAMSSLLLSVFIKMSSQIEARKGLPPEKVIQSIVSEVSPQMSDKDSAHLFYAVIDRRTFEMEYSLLGKISGLIQKFGKDAMSEVVGISEPFTKGFKREVESKNVSLQPKDRILLVTPGIINAENKNSEVFGFNKLIETVKRAPKSGVHELRNEILYANEQFTGEKNPKRDQTVIVFEVKEMVLKLAKK